MEALPIIQPTVKAMKGTLLGSIQKNCMIFQSLPGKKITYFSYVTKLVKIRIRRMRISTYNFVQM